MTIDGTYHLQLHAPTGTQEGRLALSSEDGTLSGTLSNARGQSEFAGGVIEGNHVQFDTKVPTPLGKMRAHVELSVEGDAISGSAKLPLGHVRIAGTREQ